MADVEEKICCVISLFDVGMCRVFLILVSNIQSKQTAKLSDVFLMRLNCQTSIVMKCILSFQKCQHTKQKKWPRPLQTTEDPTPQGRPSTLSRRTTNEPTQQRARLAIPAWCAPLKYNPSQLGLIPLSGTRAVLRQPTYNASYNARRTMVPALLVRRRWKTRSRQMASKQSVPRPASRVKVSSRERATQSTTSICVVRTPTTNASKAPRRRPGPAKPRPTTNPCRTASYACTQSTQQQLGAEAAIQHPCCRASTHLQCLVQCDALHGACPNCRTPLQTAFPPPTLANACLAAGIPYDPVPITPRRDTLHNTGAGTPKRTVQGGPSAAPPPPTPHRPTTVCMRTRPRCAGGPQSGMRQLRRPGGPSASAGTGGSPHMPRSRGHGRPQRRPSRHEHSRRGPRRQAH